MPDPPDPWHTGWVAVLLVACIAFVDGSDVTQLLGRQTAQLPCGHARMLCHCYISFMIQIIHKVATKALTCQLLVACCHRTVMMRFKLSEKACWLSDMWHINSFILSPRTGNLCYSTSLNVLNSPPDSPSKFSLGCSVQVPSFQTPHSAQQNKQGQIQHLSLV